MVDSPPDAHLEKLKAEQITAEESELLDEIARGMHGSGFYQSRDKIQALRRRLSQSDTGDTE